jgi:glycosyltransferase involved in cell wall biosynthesis
VLVSVIVPAYNEAARVEEALRRLRAVPIDLQVICVDDGSTDGTLPILRRLLDEGIVDVLAEHAVNRGKGAAIRTGVRHVAGAVVAIHDADLEADPAELPRLVEPIIAGRADAVFGSRFLAAGVPRGLHRLGNAALTRFSNRMSGLRLTDMETCHKVMRADLMKALPLTCDRFGIEPELAARLAQAGARVEEIPVSYVPRSYAEGKKISWRDGLAAFWHILRVNLRRPVHVTALMDGETGSATNPSLPPAPAERESGRERRAHRGCS